MASPTTKFCIPSCKFFKCTRGSIVRRGASLFCLFIEEECRGYECTYASCVRERLLANGTCGFAIKRRTELKEEIPEETLEVRVKSKVLKKIPREEIF